MSWFICSHPTCVTKIVSHVVPADTAPSTLSKLKWHLVSGLLGLQSSLLSVPA